MLLANGVESSVRPTPPDMPRYPFTHKQPYRSEGTLLAECFPVWKTYILQKLAKVDILAVTITVFQMKKNAEFLDRISATDYTHFHSILTRSKDPVWVTKTTSSESEPQHHIAYGLGRTLALEDFVRKTGTVALDSFW